MIEYYCDRCRKHSPYHHYITNEGISGLHWILCTECYNSFVDFMNPTKGPEYELKAK